jgi:hypothetical protein
MSLIISGNSTNYAEIKIGTTGYENMLCRSKEEYVMKLGRMRFGRDTCLVARQST